LREIAHAVIRVTRIQGDFNEAGIVLDVALVGTAKAATPYPRFPVAFGLGSAMTQVQVMHALGADNSELILKSIFDTELYLKWTRRNDIHGGKVEMADWTLLQE